MTTLEVKVQCPNHSYPVMVTHGGSDNLARWVSSWSTAKRVLIVTDDNVAPLHAERLCEQLKFGGIQTKILCMKPGESHKTLKTVESLYDGAIEAGVDRETLVVSVGGGVVGDVAGFLAATLLRGLPIIHVPTTVIGQVDSAIGGKTGVNLRHGKNLVGSFHSPLGVLIDVSLLDTLPSEERRAGLSEAVKHGAISDPGLLDYIEDQVTHLNDGVPDVLLEVIARAVRVKAQVVTQDYLEKGLRSILNFGHTLGHALEAQTGYGRLRHGEAVALGMMFAVRLSEARLNLNPSASEQLLRILNGLHLPTRWEERIDPELISYLSRDKKVRGDIVNFVLLEKLGQPVMVPVPVEDLYMVANVWATQDVGVNSR